MLSSEMEQIISRGRSDARCLTALQEHPAGLTIGELAEITGLTPKTVYVRGMRVLFNAQLIEKVERRDQTIYRVINHDPDGRLGR